MDWLNEYNKLREIHSALKSIMNKNDCPFWFADQKELPKNYMKALIKISNALYDAEKLTIKIDGY